MKPRPVAGASSRQSSGGCIAILGAACRLPGAADPDAFWELLREARDVVTTVPADRFSQASFLHPRHGEPGRTYSFAAGTLGDVAGFDPAAFGISPREAVEMDPQQRLLLELAREAMEDAGLPPSTLAGSGTGVFIGASLTDYADLRLADPASGDRWFMTGGALSILANRLGNVFDLRGPAQTIDTACSSGLVALHLAAEALRAGRLPAAVVGAVNMLLSPFPFLGFAKAGMLSPSGRCRAFDAAADGYVRAEGGVVLVLKRLEDALAAGDAVRAVLLGTATNAAGRTVGLSLPSGAAQQALIEAVMDEAGVTADRFGYFEAHGTGTAAGDPIEAAAIGAAIGQRRSTTAGALPIGSAKSNLGHTEPASGLVGLLKGMLTLEHGRIPPTLHVTAPNPAIDFAGLGLRVATSAAKLDRSPDRRDAVVIGVNSFGFGGTNACALLARAPVARLRARAAPLRAGAAPRPLPPLLLSAHSPEALRTLSEQWQRRLAVTPARTLPSLLRGAAQSRDLLPHRLAVRGATPAALAASLAASDPDATLPARLQQIAFVFSGNGAQWPGMARGALAASPALRRGIGAADAVLAPLLGWSVLDRLRDGVTAEELARTDLAQPLLYAVQLGIVAALAEEGITPEFCLGHSVGEVAAAQVAGLLDAGAAAQLIVARSRHQHAMRGIGGMAALGAAEEDAWEALERCGPGLEIAALNAPQAMTVAGPRPALSRLGELAAARGWSFIPLDLDYAFHSAAMDPVRQPLLGDLAGLAATQAPGVPMISCVTGSALSADDCTPEYWWRNLRQTVRFDQAVAAAATRGAGLFLEIGPNPALQSYLRDSLRAAGVTGFAVLPTLSRREEMERVLGDPIAAAADRAFARGADPRHGPGYRGPVTRRGLPRTPFARTPHWFARTLEAGAGTAPMLDHPLLGARLLAEPGLWQRILDTAVEPWLADHRLAGQPVLPAAAMIDMALAAGAARHPGATALEVADFAILRALPLESGHARELRCTLDTAGRFSLASRRRLVEEEWTLHAEGRVVAVPFPAELAARGQADAAAEFPRQLDGGTARLLAARIGLDYGPAFHGLAGVACDPARGCGKASLVLPQAAPADGGFLLHPVRLDAALQGAIALLADSIAAEADDALVPVRLTRLVIRRGAAPPAEASFRLAARGTRSAAIDLILRDAAGMAVGLVEGCWLHSLRLPNRHDLAHSILHVEWLPADAGSPGLPAPIPLAAILSAARKRDAACDAVESATLLGAYCGAAVEAALASRALSPRAPGLRALRAILARHGVDGSAPLPSAAAIWRQVLLEQPNWAPELAWAATEMERLPLLLADGDPDDAGLGGVSVPSALAGFDHLSDVLLAAIQEFAAAWPTHRPLRVLEIVGGAPDFTRRAVATLGASGCRVLYRAILPADAPPRGEASSDFANVEFSQEVRDPEGGTSQPELADLILGLAIGLSAERPGEPAATLRQAVAPGATLLLAEALPGLFWELCRALQPAFREDPAGTPLLRGAGDWTRHLAGEGWCQAEAIPLVGCPWPAGVVAARRPVADQPPTPAVLRRVVLLADRARHALRSALAEALAERGALVAIEDPDRISAIPPRSLRNSLLVVLPEATTVAALAVRLAALGRLAAAAEGQAAALAIVTQGGQHTGDGSAADEHSPISAGLFAAGRVLANEHPGLAVRRLDLSPRLGVEAAARSLAQELLGEADGENEVALSGSGRRVPRLRRGLPTEPLPRGAVQLAIGQPGQLASLTWSPLRRAAPGPGEVALLIEACGINFRDLLWAQGLLPEEILLAGLTGPTLGMECAGRVTAVGQGVTDFRPGDRVFGVAPAALASHAVTRAEALAHLPQGLSPVAAATVPVAFLTASLALEELARIEAGERVLIHGGAGAVGLAALQVATARGAMVAATAGTPARRAFLRLAGAALVLDSRDPGFADALRAQWPGGVDVVLNSISGEAMERSLGLLRPFGRFIELGKRDFAEARSMPMRPLRRNITWHALDADELARARPVQAARVLREVGRRLEAGELRPLPATIYAAAEAEAAFRALQGSRHIGKLVLRPPLHAREQPEEAPAGDALAEAAQGTVVIVGGTGGFGLATAQWLAERGVRHLALLSRRGPASPELEAGLPALTAAGATVAVHGCDATEERALDAVLRRVRDNMPRIRGVVHAGAIHGDGAAASLDPAQAGAVLAAKLVAAENLDRLTADDPISLFLLFSSLAVTAGNPGQVAYVAANAALEALARRRGAAGRPALAVRWGPIADAGVLASNADGTVEMLRRRTGLVPVPAVTALAALPALLAGATAAPGIAPPGWAHAARGLAVLNEPCFRHAREVAEPSAATAEADLREMLGSAEESAALALLREALSGEVARILRMPPASVTADATLARLGLDSLGGMELRVALEQRLRMPVPLTAVSDTLTLDALARRILAALRSAAPSDSGVAALLAAHEPGAAPILSKMPPSGSDLEAAA